MTLAEFEFNNRNHFVAMEYYALILNRTFLVLQTKDFLIGLRVRGLVGIESNHDIITKWLSSKYAIHGDINNYWSYVRPKLLLQYNDLNLTDGSILKIDKANFLVNRNDIKEINFDPSKKWGVGYYPHDGKVYITTSKFRNREFIILANQSGKQIAEDILFFK